MSIHDIRSAANYRQTVLVLDDQPLVLAIHAAMLRSVAPALHIVTMTDPVDALDWLRQKQVDLIIMDYRMHRMDGIRFVDEVRFAENGRMQPIIVVTALNDEKVHRQLLASGVTACFVKPAPLNQLSTLARTLLEKNRGRSANNQYCQAPCPC
jgi:two-component system, chemotaxis family, chemotaxis protein CheY